MSDLIEKARKFATAAHGAIGQKRKYTDVGRGETTPFMRPLRAARFPFAS